MLHPSFSPSHEHDILKHMILSIKTTFLCILEGAAVVLFSSALTYILNSWGKSPFFLMSFHCQLSAAEKSKTLELFTTRRNEYRIAALTCKKHGDIQQAKQFLAVSKVKE